MTPSEAKEIIKWFEFPLSTFNDGEAKQIGSKKPPLNLMWQAKGFLEGREYGIREAAEICSDPIHWRTHKEKILALLEQKP